MEGLCDCVKHSQPATLARQKKQTSGNERAAWTFSRHTAPESDKVEDTIRQRQSMSQHLLCTMSSVSHAIQRHVVSDVVTRTETTLENETVTMCSEDQKNDTPLILTTSFTWMVFLTSTCGSRANFRWRPSRFFQATRPL